MEYMQDLAQWAKDVVELTVGGALVVLVKDSAAVALALIHAGLEGQEEVAGCCCRSSSVAAG